MRKLYGSFILLLTAAIWGFAFVAQSKGMDYVGPFTFHSVRSIIGGVVLIPLVLISRAVKKNSGTYKPMTRAERGYVLKAGAICGVVLCAASCLQQVGILYTSVGKSGFLTSMYVVIVPIFSLIFLRKRLSLRTVVCIALAVVGLYFMSMSGAMGLSRGDALVIACAFCFAIHILVIDHYSPNVDGVLLSCIQFIVSGILAAIPMLIFEKPELSQILAAWLPILYAGVMSCGVAYTLQIIGQRYCEPTTATLLMSFESVFSMVGGIIILHQIPTLRETIGCVILLAAVMIIQIPAKRQGNG